MGEHSFKVASSTAGLLSARTNVYDTIENGLDVQGEINGEEATGKGQILTGNVGNSNTDGLAIRYTGEALQVNQTLQTCHSLKRR